MAQKYELVQELFPIKNQLQLQLVLIVILLVTVFVLAILVVLTLHLIYYDLKCHLKVPPGKLFVDYPHGVSLTAIKFIFFHSAHRIHAEKSVVLRPEKHNKCQIRSI